MTAPQHTFGWADVPAPVRSDKPLPLTIAEGWLNVATFRTDTAQEYYDNGYMPLDMLWQYQEVERIIASFKEARYNAAQYHDPSNPLIDHEPVKYTFNDPERLEIRVYWVCKRCGVEIEQ